MFPELPTCSPFANKIPRFKPGLGWSALPSSSESVYPEITVSTARSATEEIVDVFSADTPFRLLSFSFCICTRVVMYFSLYLAAKNLLLREVTFSPVMSRTPFLSYAMRCLVQNKNQDASRGDCACPEVGGFWPSNIVFTVTPPGKKNDRDLQMEAER